MGLKLEFLDDPPEKHNSYFHHVLKDDESAIDLDIQINFGENCYNKMWTWNRWMHLTNIYKTKTRQLMLTHTKSENINEYMPYIHFKMETLQSFVSLIPPGCYLLFTPRCLLLCAYTPRSNQVSKVHLEKSTV